MRLLLLLSAVGEGKNEFKYCRRRCGEKLSAKKTWDLAHACDETSMKEYLEEHLEEYFSFILSNKILTA
jgi:hypothetical protein